jgi:putative peptidoglycan lipid II flippase
VKSEHRFVGSAKLIATFTLGSRILGLVREHAYSRFFGASPLFSAFRIAFQIPNLARRLFGEGALTASFIPVFTQTRAAGGDAEAQRLAGGILTLLATVLCALLLAGELIIALLVWRTPSPTLSLTALLLPYMLLICLTAFFAGMLNALNHFAAPAAAPMILNLVIIAVAWIGGTLLDLSPYAHLRCIAIAVLIAGGLQLGVQLWWLRRCRFRVRFNLDWRSVGVRRVVTLMTPMMLGMSALQVNTFLDSMIAFYFVADGDGPSLLGYAQYMSNLPLGIFSTALATAVFPLLAQHAASQDSLGHRRAVEAGLRTSLFIAIPASAGLMLVATPLVRVLFEGGAFTPADTRRVVLALCLYSVGLWAYAAQQMLVRAFHSLEESRTPVRIALSMLVLNLVLNLLLVRTALQEAGVALATAICAAIQTLLLAIAFQRRFPGMRWRGVLASASRCLIAAAAMSAVVAVLRGMTPLGNVLPAGDLLQLLACVPIGAGVYLLTARWVGLEEGAILLRRRQPPLD